jgi:hypothetical protein
MPYRPSAAILFNTKTGENIDTEHSEKRGELTTVVSRLLFRVMTNAPACRPARVVFDRADMLAAFEPKLTSIGVESSLVELPYEIRDTIHQATAALERPNDFLGASHFLKDDPAALRDFFAAAADFYLREPWANVVNVHVVEARYPPDAPPR